MFIHYKQIQLAMGTGWHFRAILDRQDLGDFLVWTAAMVLRCVTGSACSFIKCKLKCLWY